LSCPLKLFHNSRYLSGAAVKLLESTYCSEELAGRADVDKGGVSAEDLAQEAVRIFEVRFW
jgi:hypothetical protein